MSKTIKLFLLVVALQGCALCTNPVATGLSSLEYYDLIQEVKPALVQITATNPEGAFIMALSETMGIDVPNSLQGLIKIYGGSGFLVDPSGVVVTNEHVTHPGWLHVVTLASGKEYMVEGLASIEKVDIAVLTLRAVESELPFVEFAKHGAEQGDSIWMLGRNSRFDMSFKNGVVSHTKRSNKDGSIDLQTTMPIIPGESGSAAFNNRGKVIGVVQGYYPKLSGISSLVPGDIAREAVKILRRSIERERRKK